MTEAELFGRWNVDEEEIEFRDRSTKPYINITPVAHTMGRHADKQFEKSEINVVERIANRLMAGEQNTGKKEKTTKIVREALDEIAETTGDNPLEVVVRAVENAGPREETVTLKYGGISVPKAVDVAPQRRVDQAIKFITDAVESGSYKNSRDAHEVLAGELMSAANYDVETPSIRKKEEVERVAAAAR